MSNRYLNSTYLLDAIERYLTEEEDIIVSTAISLSISFPRYENWLGVLIKHHYGYSLPPYIIPWYTFFEQEYPNSLKSLVESELEDTVSCSSLLKSVSKVWSDNTGRRYTPADVFFYLDEQIFIPRMRKAEDSSLSVLQMTLAKAAGALGYGDEISDYLTERYENVPCESIRALSHLCSAMGSGLDEQLRFKSRTYVLDRFIEELERFNYSKEDSIERFKEIVFYSMFLSSIGLDVSKFIPEYDEKELGYQSLVESFKEMKETVEQISSIDKFSLIIERSIELSNLLNDVFGFAGLDLRGYSEGMTPRDISYEISVLGEKMGKPKLTPYGLMLAGSVFGDIDMVDEGYRYLSRVEDQSIEQSKRDLYESLEHTYRDEVIEREYEEYAVSKGYPRYDLWKVR